MGEDIVAETCGTSAPTDPRNCQRNPPSVRQTDRQHCTHHRPLAGLVPLAMNPPDRAKTSHRRCRGSGWRSWSTPIGIMNRCGARLVVRLTLARRSYLRSCHRNGWSLPVNPDQILSVARSRSTCVSGPTFLTRTGGPDGRPAARCRTQSRQGHMTCSWKVARCGS